MLCLRLSAAILGVWISRLRHTSEEDLLCRTRLLHCFDGPFDLTQRRAVLERFGAVGAADDHRLADADAEVPAQLLVALEALGDGAAGAAVVLQVFLPFGAVQFLDATGDRVEEVLVDAEVAGFFLVAEEG